MGNIKFDNQGWSVSASHWRNIMNLVDGTEWHRVIFETSENLKVKRTSGIYVIAGKVPFHHRLDTKENPEFWDSFYNVLYVGRSSCLRDRFLSHVRNKKGIGQLRKLYEELSGPESLFFHWAEYDVNKEELADKEDWLIDGFRPTVNARNEKGEHRKKNKVTNKTVKAPLREGTNA